MLWSDDMMNYIKLFCRSLPAEITRNDDNNDVNQINSESDHTSVGNLNTTKLKVDDITKPKRKRKGRVQEASEKLNENVPINKEKQNPLKEKENFLTMNEGKNNSKRRKNRYRLTMMSISPINCRNIYIHLI